MLRLLAVLCLVACHRPAPAAQGRRDAAAPAAPHIDAAPDAPHIDAAPDALQIDGAPAAPRTDAARAVPRSDAAAIDAGTHYAREGEVCRKGGARGALSPETPCEPGLHCCYPCGIQGCSYVCKRVCISAP